MALFENVDERALVARFEHLLLARVAPERHDNGGPVPIQCVPRHKLRDG